MDNIYDFLANNYIIFILISIFIFLVLVGNLVTYIKNRKKDDSFQPIDMEKVNNENKNNDELLMDEQIKENTLKRSKGVYNQNIKADESYDSIPSLDQFENNNIPNKVVISSMDGNGVFDNKSTENIEIFQTNNLPSDTQIQNTTNLQSQTEPQNVEIIQTNNQNLPNNNETNTDNKVTYENLFVIEDTSSNNDAGNVPTSTKKNY